MEHRFQDEFPVGEVRKTRDGYLTARVHAARTGIQDYRASEIGLTGNDVVKVYRPESEVFNVDSLGTFKGKPITMGHPDDRVTADNHKELARGHIGNVARDGQAVALDVAITDAKTVEMLEGDGPRELSAGYTAQIDHTPGVTPDGQHYDAVQRGIYVDHLAIVSQGRAGSEFRIGDGVNWGARPLNGQEQQPQGDRQMSDQISVVVADGKVLTDEAGAAIVQSLADKAAELETTVETKDGEIAALKAELADAKDPKKIADMAKKRAKVRKAGEKYGMSEEETEAMEDSAIMRAVVSKALGDAAKEMSDAALEGAFQVIAAGDVKLGDEAMGGGVKHADADPWAFLDKK